MRLILGFLLLIADCSADVCLVLDLALGLHGWSYTLNNVCHGLFWRGVRGSSEICSISISADCPTTNKVFTSEAITLLDSLRARSEPPTTAEGNPLLSDQTLVFPPDAPTRVPQNESPVSLSQYPTRVPVEPSTVAEAPSLPDQPLVLLSDSQMRFVALGDVGYANEELRTTAGMLQKKMSQVNAAFLLGDNFYPRGISKEAGLADPQFSGVFENILAPSLDAPFYVVLGNHDFMGDAEAQVEYSRKNPKWILPGYYYFKRFQASDFSTCVWFLDTEHFSAQRSQNEWLVESLTSEGPLCRWKIVIGHHPIFDVGEYDDDAALIASLLPILNSFNVNLYISGHEHQSQVMYNPMFSPVTFIVSGITQEIRSKIQKPDHPLFVWSDAKKIAFLELVITSENLVYSFHRSAGGRAAPPLYTGTMKSN